MDTLEAFHQNVEQELNHARQSVQRNQGTPVHRARRDRQHSIQQMNFNIMHDRLANAPSDTQIRIAKTIVTGECHSSTTPLNELKPITLSQLKVPMVHTGRYLACRTVSEQYVIVATAVLIEDLNGEVEDLSLYNFRVNIGDGKWLPPGTIMFIKEPYMKHGSMGTNSFIRVDSPSDVVFVDETNQQMLQWANALQWYKPQKLNCDQLRAKGNDCYKRGDYENSLKYYNQGLMIEPTSGILNLNKAAALLFLEQYFEAFKAAKLASENGADKEKSLLRLGRAAYGMHEWEQASRYFVQVIKDFPDNKEAKIDLKNTTDRLKESRNGQYDLMRLYDLAYTQKKRRVDVADYTGPVSIVDIPGKGRGLVASKNIPKGTLLLVSKAFATTYDDELPNVVILSVNMLNDKGVRKTEALNLIKTVQNLKRNPQRAEELYALYAGNLPTNTQIPGGVLDISRIENICTFNSFLPEESLNIINATINDESTPDLKSPTGLWILPSFINHSCDGNSHRIFYGDVMMVFALTDINKDEEITFGYVDVLKSLQDRALSLQHYNFVCKCRLCQLDRSDPNYRRRGQLVEQCMALKKLITTDPKQCVRRTEPLLKQISESYGSRSELKTQMYFPLVQIALAYRMIDQHEKGLKFLKEVRPCLTLSLQYLYGIKVLINQADCNACLNRDRDAKRNIREAMMLSKISMGSDEKLFSIIYPESQIYLR